MILRALCVLAACVWSKPIDVSLDAPWRAPSESTLILETVARYNQSSYFPLLSTLLSARERGDSPANSPEETQLLYSSALTGHFLTPTQLALVEQEYKLGTSLPRFEQNYQQFEALDADVQKCPVVMWTDGAASCDQADLYALQFTTSQPEQLPGLTETDKVIGNGPQWIILYADVDSPEFAHWHSALLALALEQKITYVLRYRPASDSAKVAVAGYGVALHSKRTDYLVIDDRQLEGEKLELNLDAPPKIAEDKLPFLSFAAARKIREFAGSDEEKLDLLRELSFNFPNHAADLAADASEADEQAELEMNAEAGLGANGVFVNGLVLDQPDVFSFYDTLRKEEQLISALRGYLPEGTDIPELLVSGAALDAPIIDGMAMAHTTRYNLQASPDAITWINDIETDRPYAQMDSSLSALADATGAFAPIRRNIHSVVIAGELDNKTLSVIAPVIGLAARQLPVQVGIVSSSPLWKKVSKLGIDARQAFLVTLLQTKDAKEAFSMAKVAHEAASADGVSAGPVTGNPKEWMERFGVSPENGPVIFVNGFAGTPSNWQELAMNVFSADTAQLKALATEFLDPEADISGKPDLEHESLRDVLFASGQPKRNLLRDPVSPVEFAPWPLSPMQLFTNPEITEPEAAKQTVLLSSSFSSPAHFDLLDHLLETASETGAVEVAVRPLKGIDERFYSSLMDPQFNMFRFSRDLVKAARAHFFEKKTAPKVFTAASAPPVRAEDLPGEADSIVVDGRLIPLTEEINASLLDMLLEREQPRVERLRKLVPGISGVGIAALSSAAQDRIQIRDTDVPDLAVKSKSSQSSAISFVIDPASATAQELLGLAEAARKADLSVSVYLTPSRLESVPTRLYRPVYNRFEHARFEDDAVNDNRLYSFELVEPPSWLTVMSDCDYDLDNVVLSMVKEDELRAIYGLRSFLIEGVALGPDAPGTRLQLVGLDGSVSKDTFIMANLGYFQLQAERPGVYHVCVADGQEKAFFGYETTSDCIPVPVTSYDGARLKPGVVSGPPERRVAETLRKDTARSTSSSSRWKGVSGFLRSKRGEKDTKKESAEVNIFTVASGHLYERFASIMMLSVMKHTKHSVKFWLIENFMSPKFKEFVPVLAAEKGFEYEFVSYKWPSWLRPQSEKQRQIWGYKMLFLDVLFPQDLENIIFVDSDQIVRTDFKELLDIDLEGAPYAFTPMGDDREETEPFRFWKQGYWKRTLLDNDLKYHISALYRVDLKVFREMNVGDSMRKHYQMLSADPESLANLDQDLPNNMQMHVPIFSLPQEWLWCETWSSDEALKQARTIDLCNNPLTKEPKLDRARRQIPEWIEYDNEVAAAQKHVDDLHLSDKLQSREAAERTQQVSGEPREEHANDHKFAVDLEDDHIEL